ncbi:MAG: hypothetical protein QM784_01575 [Polyangiaceae bacterium]
MLLKRQAAVCILASAVLLGGVASPTPAFAQNVMDLDEKPAAKKGAKKNVDIDLDENAPAEQGPVTAGAPTEGFANAKKLFEKEKWSDAALGWYRVVSGDTGDDAGNKQLAEYYLAICLYRLKFYQASYAIFSVIADNKYHLKFGETLLWLAKLATQLPEPADIIERVGKYTDSEIARFDNAQQRDLYWQLNYMLGRYKYRNRQYEEAVRLFQKVDRRSDNYVAAQFFTGVSFVQKRQSIPAVRSFQRIETALEEGVKGVEDEQRMLDLAYLSMARTYYSASVRLDVDTNIPTIDGQKLSAAVKYWNKNRRFERVLAGRTLRGVLGVLHGGRLSPRARKHPHDPVALLPELLLSRSRHSQGGHLLRQLQLRCSDDRGRSFQQALRAHSRRAEENHGEVQGRQSGGGVLQILEEAPRPQYVAQPFDRTHRRQRAE